MQHLVSLAALVLFKLTIAGANNEDAVNTQHHRLSRQPLTDAETAALADNSAFDSTIQQASLDGILFKSVYGKATGRQRKEGQGKGGNVKVGKKKVKVVLVKGSVGKRFNSYGEGKGGSEKNDKRSLSRTEGKCPNTRLN